MKLVFSMCASSVMAMAACSPETDGQARECSEAMLRENWGNFPTCCADVGSDGRIHLYAKSDDLGGLVIRRYFDRSATPCVNDDGSTDCGCGSGASDACDEEDETPCDYGQAGSSGLETYGDANAVVFVPKGARESSRCGVDDNGEAEGGTHPGPASSQEFTGRQTSYPGLTGAVPWAYSKCFEGEPGVALTLRASCTGAVTGTLTSGEHTVACTSAAGGDDVVEKTFWAGLDAPVTVEHTATGWQGWAETCEGVGSCEFTITSDTAVQGQFGG